MLSFASKLSTEKLVEWSIFNLCEAFTELFENTKESSEVFSDPDANLLRSWTEFTKLFSLKFLSRFLDTLGKNAPAESSRTSEAMASIALHALVRARRFPPELHRVLHCVSRAFAARFPQANPDTPVAILTIHHFLRPALSQPETFGLPTALLPLLVLYSHALEDMMAAWLPEAMPEDSKLSNVLATFCAKIRGVSHTCSFDENHACQPPRRKSSSKPGTKDKGSRVRGIFSKTVSTDIAGKGGPSSEMGILPLCNCKSTGFFKKNLESWSMEDICYFVSVKMNMPHAAPFVHRVCVDGCRFDALIDALDMEPDLMQALFDTADEVAGLDEDVVEELEDFLWFGALPLSKRDKHRLVGALQGHRLKPGVSAELLHSAQDGAMGAGQAHITVLFADEPEPSAARPLSPPVDRTPLKKRPSSTSIRVRPAAAVATKPADNTTNNSLNVDCTRNAGMLARRISEGALPSWLNT
mmetsp:Transcript_32049/g.80428  ORF Transcript_32049/g.80428 Transcript_32049/m.80428 type:complete len:470 (+) Transcript_32049:414-1823(+)